MDDISIKTKSLWKHVIEPLLEYSEQHPDDTDEQRITELVQLWDKLPDEQQRNYKSFKRYVMRKYDDIHLKRIQ